MKIYTKKGDTGETGLYGGERVAKDHVRIRVYGTFDELNAVLGLVLADAPASVPSTLRERLTRIQSELFQLGSELATPRGKDTGMALVSDAAIEQQEKEIDEMEEKLPPLKTFVLPGGGRTSARLHLARTVSRRAERELMALSRAENVRGEVLRYVNRLSDYLFVCARFANLVEGIADVPWIAPKA